MNDDIFSVKEVLIFVLGLSLVFGIAGYQIGSEIATQKSIQTYCEKTNLYTDKGKPQYKCPNVENDQ